MEDGITSVGFVAIWHENEHSFLVQLRKQTLPNGKKIPSGMKVWIRKQDALGRYDEILKTMGVNNDAINKWKFD
jgi:hypothetical protein